MKFKEKFPMYQVSVQGLTLKVAYVPYFHTVCSSKCVGLQLNLFF